VQHRSQPIRLHAARTFIVGPTPPYYCLSDLQGVVNCYVSPDVCRTPRSLSSTLLIGWEIAPRCSALPARTFRLTSCSFRLRPVGDPAVLTYPNSPDCRPDIGHLSPVLVGRTQVPSLIFTDTAESFQANVVGTVNEASEPKQASRPSSSETRPNTLHFHFIASFEVPQTRKRSAVLLWLFKH